MVVNTNILQFTTCIIYLLLTLVVLVPSNTVSSSPVYYHPAISRISSNLIQHKYIPFRLAPSHPTAGFIPSPSTSSPPSLLEPRLLSEPLSLFLDPSHLVQYHPTQAEIFPSPSVSSPPSPLDIVELTVLLKTKTTVGPLPSPLLHFYPHISKSILHHHGPRIQYRSGGHRR